LKIIHNALWAGLVLLAAALAGAPSGGATLTYSGDADVPPSPITQTQDPCTITPAGVIAAGDAARFAALAEQAACKTDT